MAKTITNLDKAYKLYKKTVKAPVSRQEYGLICKTFNKELVTTCLEGEQIKLPKSLGILGIFKRQTNINNLSIDFKATAEAGEKRYHLNLHTDGWYCFWQWTKNLYSVKKGYHYKFVPTWSMKRTLTKVIKEKSAHLNYLVK